MNGNILNEKERKLSRVLNGIRVAYLLHFFILMGFVLFMVIPFFIIQGWEKGLKTNLDNLSQTFDTSPIVAFCFFILPFLLLFLDLLLPYPTERFTKIIGVGTKIVICMSREHKTLESSGNKMTVFRGNIPIGAIDGMAIVNHQESASLKTTVTFVSEKRFKIKCDGLKKSIWFRQLYKKEISIAYADKEYYIYKMDIVTP